MATSNGATARGRRTPCLRPVLAGVTVVAAVLLGGCSGAGDGSAPDPADPGMVAARTHAAARPPQHGGENANAPDAAAWYAAAWHAAAWYAAA